MNTNFSVTNNSATFSFGVDKLSHIIISCKDKKDFMKLPVDLIFVPSEINSLNIHSLIPVKNEDNLYISNDISLSLNLLTNTHKQLLEYTDIFSIKIHLLASNNIITIALPPDHNISTQLLKDSYTINININTSNTSDSHLYCINERTSDEISHIHSCYSDATEAYSNIDTLIKKANNTLEQCIKCTHCLEEELNLACPFADFFNEDGFTLCSNAILDYDCPTYYITETQTEGEAK